MEVDSRKITTPEPDNIVSQELFDTSRYSAKLFTLLFPLLFHVTTLLESVTFSENITYIL